MGGVADVELAEVIQAEFEAFVVGQVGILEGIVDRGRTVHFGGPFSFLFHVGSAHEFDGAQVVVLAGMGQ